MPTDSGSKASKRAAFVVDIAGFDYGSAPKSKRNMPNTTSAERRMRNSQRKHHNLSIKSRLRRLALVGLGQKGRSAKLLPGVDSAA